MDGRSAIAQAVKRRTAELLAGRTSPLALVLATSAARTEQLLERLDARVLTLRDLGTAASRAWLRERATLTAQLHSALGMLSDVPTAPPQSLTDYMNRRPKP